MPQTIELTCLIKRAKSEFVPVQIVSTTSALSQPRNLFSVLVLLSKGTSVNIKHVLLSFIYQLCKELYFMLIILNLLASSSLKACWLSGKCLKQCLCYHPKPLQLKLNMCCCHLFIMRRTLLYIDSLVTLSSLKAC